MISDMEDIRVHVAVLNHEVGILKNDIKWIKKLMIYLSILLTSIVAKTFI